MIKKLPLFLIVLLHVTIVQAQKSFFKKLIYSPVDSNYIQTYQEELTNRVYLAQKYTRFNIVSKNISNVLDYKPNNDLSIGIGGSYKIFTLNIGIPIPARFNPTKNSGETKALDIQPSIYSSKFIFDLIGQFYKGMYLQNTATYSPSISDSYYIRPDIYTQLIGLSAYRVMNDKKFSYRAAFIQNQRQKKSAGSLLLGVEIYHGLAKGDSAFIPDFANPDPNNSDPKVKEFSFFRIGPGVGYAHTFVFWKRFYFMASVSGNLAMGNYIEKTDAGEEHKKFSIDPGIYAKGGFGYNATNWFFGFSAFNNAIITINKTASFNNMFSVGNARFIVARRFKLNPKIKRKVDEFLPELN